MITICWIWNKSSRSHKITPKHLGGVKHLAELQCPGSVIQKPAVSLQRFLGVIIICPPRQYGCLTLAVSLQCTSKLTQNYWASSFSPPSPITSTLFSLLMTSCWLIHPKKDNMRIENKKHHFFTCWTGRNHKMLMSLNAAAWPKLQIILNLVTSFIHTMYSHWTMLLHNIQSALYDSYTPNLYWFSQRQQG